MKKLSDIAYNWESGLGVNPINGYDFGLEIRRLNHGGFIFLQIVENMRKKIKCLVTKAGSSFGNEFFVSFFLKMFFRSSALLQKIF